MEASLTGKGEEPDYPLKDWGPERESISIALDPEGTDVCTKARKICKTHFSYKGRSMDIYVEDLTEPSNKFLELLTKHWDRPCVLVVITEMYSSS